MSILERGIAREFCVGQTRSAEKEFVGADRVGSEKIVRARSANDVVLIDTVAADPDRTDEHSVAIKRKTAGENGDAIGQIKPDAVS